jgi:thioredoxin reductase (NADPH)
MMEDLKTQAERFGTEVRWGEVTRVDFSKRPFKVVVDDSHQIEAEVVIIATGASAKYLGIESEQKFRGSGVSACATCDGFFYKGKDVAVVGGGDTACEEASYLANLCSKVYIIVRKNYLRASKAMQERILNTPNIEVLFEHNTKEITGDNAVSGVTLVKRLGEPDEQEIKIKIDGFFLGIGHSPNSGAFKEYLKTDEVGYITTIPGTSKTSVEGVFACGDVQDSIYRQAITAAGSGCMAALDAERFLSEHK